jgi:SGF29 tudor-like domain
MFLNLSICRLKKGMRVYAMYPNTTSLYMATVVDNITYCRGDDDVIVVEFDEDEKGTIVCLSNVHVMI